MKKTKGMLLCATLLLGATYIPIANTIADGVKTPIDVRQDGDDTDPLDPTNPVDPPVDPTDPVDPPVDPTDPVDPPVDPTDPVDPPVDPTDPVDPPVDPTDPVDPPVKPTDPIKPPVKPTEPVNPDTPSIEQPNFDLNQESLPTESGYTIVGTLDSKPIVQLSDGTTKQVEPKEVGATVQKDGTVKVKGADGKMKVLPHTGSEDNIFLSLLGGATTLIMGGIAFVLKRKTN